MLNPTSLSMGEYEDYTRDWCEIGFRNFIAYFYVLEGHIL